MNTNQHRYMKKSIIDFRHYISKEDLEMLNDSNRNIKGSSKIIKRSLELALKAQQGDVESRNYLFLLHIPLMRHILNKKFNINAFEFEQHISLCFEAFIEAINSFNPEKSNNFVSFLNLKIYRYYITLIKSKSYTQASKTCSLDKFVETDELNSEKLLCCFDAKFLEINETE